MPSIDVDDEFLNMFYGLTGTKKPTEVNLANLKKQLTKIVDTMQEYSGNKKNVLSLNDSIEDEIPKGPAILVIDDLGVITYQLRVLLSQFEFDIDCSQEIYDAVSKFKKRTYQYVVMDLFIPTEREGFILLSELKKMNPETIVGVITASPRKEIEQQCKNRGADFFLEKNNDWQNQLFKIMSNYINGTKKDDDFY
ncbi:MAG: response regulator [Cyanobacteria bacterium SIG28]|nr:response regulator [Cyanobacteria bacterium SIG28]